MIASDDRIMTDEPASPPPPSPAEALAQAEAAHQAALAELNRLERHLTGIEMQAAIGMNLRIEEHQTEHRIRQAIKRRDRCAARLFEARRAAEVSKR